MFPQDGMTTPADRTGSLSRRGLPGPLVHEIERAIRRAKRLNKTLHTGLEARRLETLYPDTGMTHDNLCDEIRALAVAARVPTQINSAI